MSWRYVLTREIRQGEEWWTVRELYTEMKGQPDGLATTEDAVEPGGNTPMEVLTDLARMAADIHLPYLDLTQDPPVLVEHSLAEDRAAERAALAAALAALERAE